jgi:hypothetical protein
MPRKIVAGLSMADSNVEEYRARANRLRIEAAETKSAETREQFLGLARQFDALADSIERQRKPPKSAE